MSTERHLTILSLPNSEDTLADNIDNTNDVKSNIMKIIDIAKAGNELENLRTKS